MEESKREEGDEGSDVEMVEIIEKEKQGRGASSSNSNRGIGSKDAISFENIDKGECEGRRRKKEGEFEEDYFS